MSPDEARQLADDEAWSAARALGRALVLVVLMGGMYVLVRLGVAL